MEDFDKMLYEASSNVKVENKIDDDTINIIKEALLQSKETEKSFFSSLCELVEMEQNERKNNNRK